MITLDILYLLGLLVVWYGNVRQITKIIKKKSTKSLSVHWIAAIFISVGIRLPRAFTSIYWVWRVGYIISFIIVAVLLFEVLYYRRKYPKR